MSLLYIRLPSKATADSAPNWLALACPFALVSEAGAIEREGISALSNLSDTITRIQRVVLLLAGSDVSLLRMQVPPLSTARLKAALPNLVEEQLLCDPTECVIVTGNSSEGLRTIAVAQRAWLELLTRTFISLGARRIVALPAQLCLSGLPDSVTAAIYPRDTCTDLTLRLSEQDGIGLSISVAADIETAHDVIHSICAVVPRAPVTLYVPQENIYSYQEAASDTPALKDRISIAADNWTRWITAAHTSTLDLMAGMGAKSASRLDWRPWRWPLILAAAVLVINISFLNIEWWRMKSEANSLRAAMVHIYKSAYPNETVIIDPIAQMRQKLAAAKHSSGLTAADDFTSITASFGEAWTGISATLATPPAIVALEYRDHSLFVRMKRNTDLPTLQMKAALAKRDLTLKVAPEQTREVVWQIRSAS